MLGNDDPRRRCPARSCPSREFYDYEAKYLDDGSVARIPAPLDEALAAEVRRLAIEAFRAAGRARAWRASTSCSTAQTGDVFVNEMNTIPGFTTISMYAKLWAASGLAYPALLDRLIALALERFQEKQAAADDSVG